MKKIYYLLFAVMIAYTACKEEELPEANFELAEVSALTATAGDAQAVLAWTPADGFTPLEYYLSWVAGTTGVEGGEKTLDANTTSVTIDALVNDVSYTFSVQPRYERGLAGKVSATVKPLNARFPVTNFTARAGNTLVRLAWTKPASDQLSGYRITMMPGNSVIPIDNPATESYNVTGLTNDREYTFSIIGIYPQGNSEAATATATPGQIAPIVVTSATLTKNQPCTFEYNEMYFNAGAVQSVSWDFGDGATSTQTAPVHAFSVEGTYTVAATVTYTNASTESGSIDMAVTGYLWSSIDLQHDGKSGYDKCSNPVFSPDGTTAYLPTSSPNGHLFAIDVATGAINWVFEINELTYGGGALVGPDGTIYQGSDAAIYAINPNGTQKWKVTTSGSGALARVRAFPAISADGSTLYCSSNSTLYALNAGSGAERWSQALSDGASIGSAVLVGSNGNVYVGTNKGVYAYNAANGNIIWSNTNTSLNVTESGSMAINGNTIYAALKGTAGLAAINISDGSLKWSAPAEGDAYFPIVDKNGVIYFTEKLAAGKVYAINPDGTQKWTKTIGESLNYGGLALDENGIIYGGTQSKAAGSYKLYAINTATGDFVFNNDNAQQIMAAFTIGPDKRLYFGTIGSGNVGRLQAHEINAGLEPGSWSVRGGDLQGTNRQK